MKILHDIHTHNVFSNCCIDPNASTEAFVKKEEELGMKLFGLSNHIWDERVSGGSYWYKHQTIRKAKEAKAALHSSNPELKLLFGVESEYYGCKDILGLSVDGAAEFDYALVPFSHLHMRNEVMSDFPEIMEIRARIRSELGEKFSYIPDSQLDIMANSLKEADIMKIYPDLQIDVKSHMQKYIVENFFKLLNNAEFEKLSKAVPTVIAHSFAYCGLPGNMKNGFLADLPMDKIAEGYRKAASMGIAIEINMCEVKGVCRDLPNNHLLDIYKVAKAEGCKFTFGTDSHSVKGLEEIRLGDAVAQEMELTPADIAEFVRYGVEE